MASNRAQQGSVPGHNAEVTKPAEPQTVSRARGERYRHDNIIARISATESPDFVHQGAGGTSVGDVLLQDLERAMGTDAAPHAFATPPAQPASPLLLEVGSHLEK
ncbi:hypothetical protein QQX98_012652 [Neonectria punicea]|uniref:Uncharacterized protein n=1 Tax=Neonectria punicea TaxID=979145 RepID=A0ABR1GIH4_9HYPO